MAIGAIFLGLVSVVIRKGTVQPWLAESVGFTRPVTVVTDSGPVSIRPVQGVALVAGAGLVLVLFVVLVVSVLPTGPDGRLAARSTKMARIAVIGRTVTVGALILGLVTVKLRALVVQPRLTQYVVFPGAVTIVTDTGSGSKGTTDVVTAVAHGLIVLVFFMAGQAVLPIRALGFPATVGTEMTLKAPRNIFLTFTVNLMALCTGRRALVLHLGSVKHGIIHIFRIIPVFYMNFVVIRRIGIFFRAGQRIMYQHHQGEAEKQLVSIR